MIVPTVILAAWFAVNALSAAYCAGVGKRTYKRADFLFVCALEIAFFLGVVL
jgi:hypothetical protein